MSVKLSKSLYGLKQAGRQWHKELSNALIAYGFQRLAHDNCLFLKDGVNSNVFLAIIIYVDDILICGPSEPEIRRFKDHLHSLYTIKDMGPGRFFLGVEITQTKAGVFLSQIKYIIDMIQDADLTEANTASSPFATGIILHKESAILADPKCYRRLIGKLLYLGFTRPDISFTTQ